MEMLQAGASADRRESVVSLERKTIPARVLRQNNAFEVFRFGFKRSDKNETRELDSTFAPAFTHRVKDWFDRWR
jgi:hypothetical protein